MDYITTAILALPLISVWAIYAVGIVLIYRASRVLNLAHGVMAAMPAFVAYTLSGWGIPMLLVFPLAVASGGGLGYAVERLFVRPMRKESTSAQTVGTVVVLGLGIAIMARIWGTNPRTGVAVFPAGYITIGTSSLRYGQIGLFVTMLLVFVALTMLFKFTELGLLMRGSAENPRAASLMGVNPELLTSLTWVLGGALAGMAGIMQAAVANLHPYTLPLGALPGFLAALLGGLGSIGGAVIGGAAVGLMIGMVPVLPALGKVEGSPQLLLAMLGMAVMAARGKQLTAGGAS